MGILGELRAAKAYVERLADVDATLRELARRLDDLEDDLAHVNGRVSRLQGRKTGGLRNASPEGPEARSGIEDLNERIRRGEVA